MNFASLTLIVIALATSGYSNAASINEFCDDPILCEDKPKAYDFYRKDMENFVGSNSDLISTLNFDTLDEIESSYVGDDENCVGVTSVKTPFVIKNNVSSQFVVQLDNFKQKIKITQCKKAQAPCFGNVINPGFGKEAFCQQKYGSVSLYIYDPEEEEFRYQMFEVPVCCACMIRLTYK